MNNLLTFFKITAQGLGDVSLVLNHMGLGAGSLLKSKNNHPDK